MNKNLLLLFTGFIVVVAIITFAPQMPLLLMLTKSPMREYEELVVLRCPWHLITADGVLPEAGVSDGG